MRVLIDHIKWFLPLTNFHKDYYYSLLTTVKINTTFSLLGFDKETASFRGLYIFKSALTFEKKIVLQKLALLAFEIHKERHAFE